MPPHRSRFLAALLAGAACLLLALAGGAATAAAALHHELPADGPVVLAGTAYALGLVLLLAARLLMDVGVAERPRGLRTLLGATGQVLPNGRACACGPGPEA
ncbi:hypothetical protein ACFXAF_13200 [Kitasatospora sp. NPDC059463]|uniref:hypothetical protein n=1 Tax=unclassified Kitasatospora TaxID=2633591 RepID=UPI00367DAC00